MLKAPSVQALLTAARLKIGKAVSAVQSKMRSVSKGKSLYQTLGASGLPRSRPGSLWGHMSLRIRLVNKFRTQKETFDSLTARREVSTPRLSCCGHRPLALPSLTIHHLFTFTDTAAQLSYILHFGKLSKTFPLGGFPCRAILTPFITITLESQG